MPDASGEQPRRQPLDRHRGRRQAQLQAEGDYYVELVTRSGKALVFALALAFFAAGTVLPLEDDPSDSFVPLFTDGETRVISTVLALVFAVLLIFAFKRLRAHHRSKPHPS